MSETYEIRISKRYGFEHLETSTLPGTYVDANGRGVLIRFTLGELHELRDRADYYADPMFRRELADSGLDDLHRSAIKVCEQIKRAGLWETANSVEARAAYEVEYAAEMQRREVELAEYRASRAATASTF
jgi:hypothetical protein